MPPSDLLDLTSGEMQPSQKLVAARIPSPWLQCDPRCPQIHHAVGSDVQHGPSQVLNASVKDWRSGYIIYYIRDVCFWQAMKIICNAHQCSAVLCLMRLLQVQADQAAPMTTSFVLQARAKHSAVFGFTLLGTSTFLASGRKTSALPTTVRLFCARLIATQSRRGLEAKPMLFAWLLLAMKGVMDAKKC